MPIYELHADRLSPLVEATFEGAGVLERYDLQRRLRDNVAVIDPDVLILAEEFGDWDDSMRRIDLLGIDRDAKLVVIELKRTRDGSHMELQALRYAAMVASMTFEQAVEAHQRTLRAGGSNADAREAVLRFLGWAAPDEERFAQDVRIVLVAAGFSKELTTAVLWLNERYLDIRCVRMRPYQDGKRLLLEVEQLLPPEAADYMVRVRDKRQEERAGRYVPKSWDTIWSEFEQQCTADDVRAARDLCEWVKGRGAEAVPGKCGFVVRVPDGAQRHYPLKVDYDGHVQVTFSRLRDKTPFDDDGLRRDLRDRLCRIPGVEIPDDRLLGKPKFELALLRDAGAMSAFKDALAWLIRVIEEHAAGRDGLASASDTSQSSLEDR